MNFNLCPDNRIAIQDGKGHPQFVWMESQANRHDGQLRIIHLGSQGRGAEGDISAYRGRGLKEEYQIFAKKELTKKNLIAFRECLLRFVSEAFSAIFPI
jgi:hypothetical protein